MQITSIENVCSGLRKKARKENFLSYSVEDIESQANEFVESFASENGLTAHTLSALRWYFEAGDKLLEDGFVELNCPDDFMEHAGFCIFNTINISKVDAYKHPDHS